MPGRLPWRRLLAAAVLLGGLLNVPPLVFAGGGESSGREDDIRFRADWRWAGGSHGGYYPIRISLQNAGRPRVIEVMLSAENSGLPSVVRRVRIDQNASVTFSLLIPLVGGSNYGLLKVFAEGKELESLRTPVALPDLTWDGCPLSMLVISESPVDLSEYSAAVTSLQRPGSSLFGMRVSEDRQQVEPVRLPDSWLAYSGLDLVVTSCETLQKLDRPQRKALLDWTLSGGCLLLHSEQEQQSTARRIDSVVELARPGVSGSWKPVPRNLRKLTSRVEFDEYGNEISSEPGDAAGFQWPAVQETLQVRRCGRGRIVALPPDPFSGTYQDWAWLLRGIQFKQQIMPTRLGVSGRAASDEFLHFLIPGVRSVPVTAFAVVITLFALLIGPVNYCILAKRKRQGFLVVTIPLIALLSSLAMFAYSFVAHGVSVRSRVRSVTWIDQDAQAAVSMARIAWFAGFAPTDGLRFSPSTAVIPIWHAQGGFTRGHVDWTDSQHLVNGFLRSRTRTQALTVSVRDERGRLIIGALDGSTESPESLSVTSGLEWPLEALVVWDDSGNAFGAGRLDPGQAAVLTPLTEAARGRFLELLQRSEPAMPARLRDSAGQLRRSIRPLVSYAVSQGQMEQAIVRLGEALKTAPNADFARKYAAIAAEPPGIELGTDVSIVDGWHVIIGSY